MNPRPENMNIYRNKMIWKIPWVRLTQDRLIHWRQRCAFEGLNLYRVQRNCTALDFPSVVKTLRKQLSEEPNRAISPVFLKRHVMLSLKQLFGEIGAKAKVDIIKYEPNELRFVLRCENRDYVRVRASLSCASDYEGQQCFYDIKRATRNLLSLTSNSRTYSH